VPTDPTSAPIPDPDPRAPSTEPEAVDAAEMVTAHDAMAAANSEHSATPATTPEEDAPNEESVNV